MTHTASRISRDLEDLHFLCLQRDITDTAKWSSELMFYMKENECRTTVRFEMDEDQDTPSTSSKLTAEEKRLLMFCQDCMRCQEFDRAAHVAKDEQNPVLKFLHFYARYLGGEKKKLDNNADLADTRKTFENTSISTLLEELGEEHHAKRMDAFMLYLYGLILRQAGMREQAVAAFVESVNVLPIFWGSWLDLSKILNAGEEFERVYSQLPDHWLRPLFVVEARIQQHLGDDAMAVLDTQVPHLLQRTPYILHKKAAVFHCLAPQADHFVIETFKEIQTIDPYRIDGIDLYSDSLYVQGMRSELAALAHQVFDINKYTPEACCVAGNYFGIRKEHERAIEYFRRAIRLNPTNAGAWVLIGHEFMELTNHSAAIMAYRNAIEIDPKDYRAWYALGQSYEITKMPAWALYYHRQAHKLCPRDSRFLVGLGEVYERLNHNAEAIKAYWKAHSVGDVENGKALLHLGKLYETLKRDDQAASIYGLYLQQVEEMKESHPDEEANCCRFLAGYYLNTSQLDEAHNYAQKCLEFDKTQEDAREVLRKVTRLRDGETGDASEFS